MPAHGLHRVIGHFVKQYAIPMNMDHVKPGLILNGIQNDQIV